MDVVFGATYVIWLLACWFLIFIESGERKIKAINMAETLDDSCLQFGQRGIHLREQRESKMKPLRYFCASLALFLIPVMMWLCLDHFLDLKSAIKVAPSLGYIVGVCCFAFSIYMLQLTNYGYKLSEKHVCEERARRISELMGRQK